MRLLSSKRFQKVLAVLLAFVFLLPNVKVSAASKTYSDIKGHKYETALNYAVKNGLLTSKTKKINADSYITRGAVLKAVNTLLGATETYEKMDSITNLKSGDSYYKTVSIALNAGYVSHLKDDTVYLPTVKASRNYIASVLSKALNVDKTKVIGDKDSKEKMTRGEFASLLMKYAPNILGESVSKVKSGTVVVNKPGVVLSDLKVRGNLIVGDGVGTGEIELNNVRVTGNLIVRGGGENSVKIYGNSTVSSMIVRQANNKVSIKVSGDASVGLVYINDGCNDVVIVGNVGTLNVAGDNLNVETRDGSIGNVVVNGANASLSVDPTSTIETIEVRETASAATLNITGNVGAVEANASDISVVVNDNAVVGTLVSNGNNATVSGNGTLSNAVINGNDSRVNTPNTIVTISETATGSIAGQGTVTPTVAPGSNGTSNVPATTVTPGVTAEPTASVTPSVTPEPTASVTPEPTASVTPEPTGSVTPEPTGSITPEPTGSVTPEPTGSVTPEPTGTATPEPSGTITPAPTEGVSYKTDERFETGYPQIAISSQGNSSKVTIKIKLKEGVASEASPAQVYVTGDNHDSDTFATTSEAVMHGHTGYTREYNQGEIYHLIYSCQYSKVLKITDSNEYEVTFDVYNINEGFEAFFVIETDEKTSEVPTEVKFTAETGNSFLDQSAPYVNSAYAADPVAVGDMEQRTIRVYCNEQLAETDTVTGGSFTVSGSAVNARITSVQVHSSAVDTYYTNWIELTLEAQLGTDFDDLMILYMKPEEGGFTDVANVPNQLDSFVIYTHNHCSVPGVWRYVELRSADVYADQNQLLVSQDGKYACVYLKGLNSFINDQKNFSYNVTINNESWQFCGSSISTDFVRVYVKNEDAELADSYQVVLTPVNRQTGEEKATYMNMAGVEKSYPITLNNLTAKLDNRIFTDPVYSKSSKKLSFTSNSADYMSCGCQFLMKIDGVEYRLRGHIETSRMDNNPGVYEFTFDEQCLWGLTEKLENASEVTLQYSPITNYDTTFYSGNDSGKPLERFVLNVNLTD